MKAKKSMVCWYLDQSWMGMCGCGVWYGVHVVGCEHNTGNAKDVALVVAG